MQDTHETGISEKLETYFDIIEHIQCFTQDTLLNKKLIKHFIEHIFWGNMPDVTSFADLELSSLCFYSEYHNENYSLKKVSSSARRFLIEYINNDEFFSSWELLSPETLSLLRIFAYVEHTNLPDATLEIIRNWQSTDLKETDEEPDDYSEIDPQEYYSDLRVGAEAKNNIDNEVDVNPDTKFDFNILRKIGLLFLPLGFISMVIIIIIILQITGIFNIIEWYYSIFSP
ncbi:MAG: hypothetical protein IH588_14695 [Anaerolineales bacterium]|nr:hypothetical protein [Anaerolineales bacterium]